MVLIIGMTGILYENENIKKIVPEIKPGSHIMFLRSIAYLTKESRNLPSFREVKEFMGIDRHFAGQLDNEIHDSGMGDVVNHMKEISGNNSRIKGYFIYLEYLDHVEDIISEKEIREIYDSLGNDELKKLTIWK